jgi:hypothetical protein
MMLVPNYSLILSLVIILLSILVLSLEIEYQQLRLDSWRPRQR